MIVLSPLGTLAGGSAWGEWEAKEFTEMVGFIPESIENAKPLVAAIIPDYEIEGLSPILSSIFSGFIGTLLALAVIWSIKKKGTK